MFEEEGAVSGAGVSHGVGVTPPTAQRLADLAEIFQCGIGDLVVFESSDRLQDQTAYLAMTIGVLSGADRQLVMDILGQLYAGLGRKTP